MNFAAFTNWLIKVLLVIFAIIFGVFGISTSYFLVIRIGLNYFSYQEAAVATICTATALTISAVVAFFAFWHNRKNSQEPWSVIFRELHKEFWNDKDMARVRCWLCCDEAYERELLPILTKRLTDNQVSTEHYERLETLDRFCALMLRLGNIKESSIKKSNMSLLQRNSFKNLNYDWWLNRVSNHRPEIFNYIKETLPDNLYPYVLKATKNLK
jgi:hypothetical protein